jgi:hypothetical protein
MPRPFYPASIAINTAKPSYTPRFESAAAPILQRQLFVQASRKNKKIFIFLKEEV